jgi:hypothetical protein
LAAVVAARVAWDCGTKYYLLLENTNVLGGVEAKKFVLI